MCLLFSRGKKIKKFKEKRKEWKMCNREKTLNGYDMFDILLITSIISIKNVFFDDECFHDL